MKNQNEVWKQIKGYEKYQVSNLGNVRSPNVILAQGTQSRGYQNVTLFVEGKGKTFNVHRLVAQTFIPNPEGLNVVNHKNEDKTDNREENLEWCTQQYNVRYNDAHTKRGKKVYQYKEDLEFVKIWESGAQVVEYHPNLSGAGVSQSCTGKRATHGGFIWSFTELNDNEWTTNIS